MASLLDLDGLVVGDRADAFEPPVQHRPSTYGILSVIAILRELGEEETPTSKYFPLSTVLAQGCSLYVKSVIFQATLSHSQAQSLGHAQESYCPRSAKKSF